MQSKVVTREFVFQTSVFKSWHKETAVKVRESIESDCSLWKLHKFMNKKGEEGEVSYSLNKF